MEELNLNFEKKSYKPVFTVVDRGQGKKNYIRIGVAFVNGDESLTVKLDGYPTNGSLWIRDFKPWELERMAQNAERHGQSNAGGGQ